MINWEMAFKAWVRVEEEIQGQNSGTPQHLKPEGRRGTRKGYEKELLGRQKEQQESVVSWEPSDKTVSRREWSVVQMLLTGQIRRGCWIWQRWAVASLFGELSGTEKECKDLPAPRQLSPLSPQVLSPPCLCTCCSFCPLFTEVRSTQHLPAFKFLHEALPSRPDPLTVNSRGTRYLSLSQHGSRRSCHLMCVMVWTVS